MNENKRIPQKFFHVIKHQGVVTVISWSFEPHIVNTTNSYIVVTDDGRLLIPAYGFRKTEKNVNVNNKIKLALGSREVLGYKDYQGTGFIVTGTARYISSGDEYEYMKKKFPFLTRVFEVTVDKATQML